MLLTALDCILFLFLSKIPCLVSKLFLQEPKLGSDLANPQMSGCLWDFWPYKVQNIHFHRLLFLFLEQSVCIHLLWGLARWIPFGLKSEHMALFTYTIWEIQIVLFMLLLSLEYFKKKNIKKITQSKGGILGQENLDIFLERSLEED